MTSEQTPSDSVAKRRLTVTHMAIARGWIQGLELPDLASRYMGDIGEANDDVDLRRAKSVLTWILDDLANLAKRSRIAGGVTLQRQAKRIRLDPNSPSLADFVESLDVDPDFYSEAELTALFQQEHGASGKKAAQVEARRDRLIKRQMNLIAELTIHLSAPMALNDRVAAWLEDGLATRLFYAGIETIEQLVFAIVRSPDDWFENVKGVGQGKASRVCRFLAGQLGPLDDCLARAGIVVPSSGTVVANDISLLIERLDETAALPSPTPLADTDRRIDEDLTGANGALRAQSGVASTSAKNDLEAMETWLSQKESDLTKTLYRREVERLMAWAIRERGKAMSSLKIEDAMQYRTFLSNVPLEWVSPKGPRQPLAPGEWKTFAGSLQKSTIKKALVIIRGFYKWLVETNYIVANPFAGVKPISALPRSSDQSTSASDLTSIERDRELHRSVLTRTLPHQAKEAVERELRGNPEAQFTCRAAFVFHFLIETGLRISEIAAARWANVEYHEANGEDPAFWALKVTGKREIPRTVLMSVALMEELFAYFRHRNLPDKRASISNGTYLIGRLPKDIPAIPEKAKRPVYPEDGVKPQTLHRTLVTLFRRASVHLDQMDSESRERLEAASTHWLRHTCATDMLDAGVPTDVVMDALGHSSLQTTSIYIHPEKARRAKALQGYWQKRPGGRQSE